MELHDLRPAKGAVRKRKRLGRGEASGKGGTATKGNKGHQSRAGFKYKWSHEGGQMPLQRRVPKRGFKNPFRVSYKTFNLYQVDALVKKYGLEQFDPGTLYEYNLIKRTDKVKLLAEGALEAKLTFRVHKISEKAKQILAAQGSTVEVLQQNSNNE